jgi:prepilin-type N-terminal cleavage/methylation domain-containing protein
MWHLRDERGFSFIELLVVVLLLGILILIAAPNYFGAEGQAKSKVDQANVRSINATLALYRFKNNGTCPADATAFNAFMADTTYFPDGTPTDPYTGTSAPYAATYDASLCRVKMSNGTVDHATGAGH